MVSAIDVNWVASLLPKLKDPVDVDRLNSGSNTNILEDKEESKNYNSILGKRKADVKSSVLESKTIATELTQEQTPLSRDEKLSMLKERY